MSSIYIGIPVIHDQEFFHTIENCLEQADNPRDIHFGVYALCDNEFWEQSIYKYSLEHNMSIFTDELSWENLGIGKGRIKAGSMYKGEDYVMSIDSHTMFGKHWDTLLKDRIETFNNKVIFTGLAGHYDYDGENRSFSRNNSKLGFPKFIGSKYHYGDTLCSIKNCMNCFPEYIDIHDYQDQGVVKCLLWNGNFSFSKSNFFEDLSDIPLHNECWIQTCELIDKDYILLTPLYDQPTITHLYLNYEQLSNKDLRNRWTYSDYLTDEKIEKHNMLINGGLWSDYKKNNFEKVNNFEKYAEINIY